VNIAQSVLLIVLAAAAGEGVNEFFFLPWLDSAKGKWDELIRVQVCRLWSGAVGVVIAYELQIDVFALLEARPVHAWFGWALTGLLIGRGANWIHDLIKRFVLQEPSG